MVDSKATVAAVKVEHAEAAEKAEKVADRVAEKAAAVEVKHDRALDSATDKADKVAALVAEAGAEYAAVRWHPNAKGMDLVKLDAVMARLQAAV